MQNKELLKALKSMPAGTTPITDVIIQHMNQYWGGLTPPRKNGAMDWRQICCCLVYCETAQKTLLTKEEWETWWDLTERAKTKWSVLVQGRNKTTNKLYNILSGAGLGEE